MNINDLTIGQARELAGMFDMHPTGKRLPIAVGEKLFIMTITSHFTGRVTAVSEEEIEIVDAAWIASDGRFADAMKTCSFDEVEPFPDGVPVTLSRATFLALRRLDTLPRSQK